MKKQQSGFTLIELVVVIVILGILAATAIPRFADLSGEAKTAARAGVVGGLNSAIAIVHAKWLAAGSTGTTVALEGATTVTVNAAGYPDVGAATTYKDATTCGTLVTALLGSTNGYTVGFAGAACTVTGSPTAYASPVSLTATSAS